MTDPIIQISPDEVAGRLMRYVQIDTQSDPHSTTSPTTEKQKNLSRMLRDELRALGIADAETDDFGYVYATLPGNTDNLNVPAICFCAHVDTAPDYSGEHVKPILHRHYDGGDIILPDDSTKVLRASEFPYLKQHVGKDIITASGTTLLGGDDKAGVAILMTAVDYLLQNPQIKHGPLKIVFTPDEEVGRGTANIDLQKIGAPFAYTLDGGECGEVEDETFSADKTTITITGFAIHPGYAKGKMINALKIAGTLLDALPKNSWSPETTDQRDGFVHPNHIAGNAEKAVLHFFMRDFSLAGLAAHHVRLKKLAEDIVARTPGATMTYEVIEQYRNMKDTLDTVPFVTDYAVEAVKRAGVPVVRSLIRGGTDGSRLTAMGMPCPNLFTGMQNIHGPLEWIGTSDMAKSVEMVIHLAMIWEERGLPQS